VLFIFFLCEMTQKTEQYEVNFILLGMESFKKYFYREKVKLFKIKMCISLISI